MKTLPAAAIYLRQPSPECRYLRNPAIAQSRTTQHHHTTDIWVNREALPTSFAQSSPCLSRSNTSMPVLLFLTSPEMGQANSQAAVMHALAEMEESHHNIEVHVASYKGLKTPLPDSVTRHTLLGQGVLAKVDEGGADKRKAYSFMIHSPGFLSNLRFITHHSRILHPESPSQYIETTLDIIRLIEKLQPDVCILDPFFSQAHDAVTHCGTRHMILHPLDTRHVAVGDQGSGILKLPPCGAGFRYPMNLLDSFYTFYTLVYSVIWYMVLDPQIRAITKARHQAGFSGPIPFLVPSKERTMLMSSDPALEYPVITPSHIAPCGPIIMPAQPVSEVDPELAEWLGKGPVILIVLGSHVLYSKQELQTFQECLSVILQQRKDLRLLWKVVKMDNVDVQFEGIEEDRVRIVDWLKPMPVAVLQSGQVAVFVNHGGSNSYHEGLATGTPQIILSAWADCHDNARMVEWLGVGIWGNRKAAPGYNAQELTRAFTTVLGSTPSSPESSKIRKRVTECKGLIDAHWDRLANGRTGKNGRRLEGRDFAAFEILGMAKGLSEADGKSTSSKQNGHQNGYQNGYHK